MQSLSTRQSLRVAILMEMLEEVSRATDPEEAAQAFSMRIGKIRPHDAFVAVSTRGLPEGQYKLTRMFHIDDRGNPDSRSVATSPWRNWNRLPARQGGLIGDLIATPEPRLLLDLDVRDDPSLGSFIAGMGSCLAVPLFDQGKVLNWAFSFRRHPHGFTMADLEDSLLTSNLFGAMTRNLVSLEQVRRLHDRLQAQFEDVARVQQALLPRSLPHVPGLRFASSYLTSDQAGGDYYDFTEVEGGAIGMIVADVSGHGAPAATVMAMLHAIMHSYSGGAGSPAAALRFANRRLCETQIDGSFVTAFAAVYHPGTRELVFCRAGHPMPRLKDTRTGAVSPIDGAAAMPLGITDELDLTDQRITLQPGHSVIMFTDGITEAFSPQREMFGTDGLDAALEACTGDPDCVIESVHAALHRHTGRLTRDDDQTIVAFKVLAEGES